MTQHRSWRAFRLALFSCLSVAVLPGCVDQSTAYEDKPFFEDPASVAGGFLGYTQAQPGSPVCANCHAAPNAQWQGTAHAGAWEALGEAADASCESCHAVSELGNAATEPAGWTATADARYHDVQCESCHGPGETHVANPQASQPIPSLAVGLDLKNGCGECHRGAHQPFVEQWSQSKHAEVVESAAARAECAGCHRGQGVLLAWGVRSRYLEQDSEEPLPIVCGVCHDPHDRTFDGQLRFPVETTDVQLHLCARCHNRRAVPDPFSSRGLSPHSPETELLAGEAGWFPPGSDIEGGDIVATHGSAGNPKLCATCHVDFFTVSGNGTDSLFNSVGHLFSAIPCVDERGIPVAGDCEISTQARTFRACASAGCHASPDGAAGLLLSQGGRIDDLATALLALLLQVDDNLGEAGGEIDPGVSTFTVAEGAFFNYNLANHGGDVYGSTTHNPFLMESLLEASIDAVEDEYGVSAP